MAARRQRSTVDNARSSRHRPATSPKRRTAGTSAGARRPSARSASATRPRRPGSRETRRRPTSPGRRLGPRRLGPRRGASRIQWDRLGRICLTVVLFAIACSYLNPAINLFNSYRANSETQQNLRQLIAENARLEARSKALRDPVVLAKEARRQGMVAPGERPYVLRGFGG